MLELKGNIWDYLGRAVIAITTNGYLSKNGVAILGRGCAAQAGKLFPDFASRLGMALASHGNHVTDLGGGLVSFPVEETPWALPDFGIIGRSARELRELADRDGWNAVVVPRPGCGGGGLSWHEVRPILLNHFDDRFIVMDKEVF